MRGVPYARVVVFSLMYASTTDHDWSQDELVALLDWSRAWNLEHEVTGLLLYRDCAFMQFLEGEEATVQDLFDHIRKDRRHQDVDLMWTNHADHRRFADWTMAFRDLVGHPVAEPGYSRAIIEALEPDDSLHPDVMGDFLSMFRPG